MEEKPKIAIAMGDPAGLGPEWGLLALRNPDFRKFCTPILFADASVCAQAAEMIGLEPAELVVPAEEWKEFHGSLETPLLVDLNLDCSFPDPGHLNEETARVSQETFLSVRQALELGEVSGAILIPPMPQGQPFADGAEAGESLILSGREISCGFVTHSQSVADALTKMTEQSVLEAIRGLHKFLGLTRDEGIAISICALNPDAGAFEREVLMPAVEQARGEGIEMEDPLPAKEVWKATGARAIICLTQEQGELPLALRSDPDLCWIRAGLGEKPVLIELAECPDLSLAWQGMLDPAALFYAVEMAAKLV